MSKSAFIINSHIKSVFQRIVYRLADRAQSLFIKRSKLGKGICRNGIQILFLMLFFKLSPFIPKGIDTPPVNIPELRSEKPFTVRGSIIISDQRVSTISVSEVVRKTSSVKIRSSPHLKIGRSPCGLQPHS